MSLMLSCGHYMSIADNFKVSKGGKKEEDKFYALDSKDV